MCLKKLIKKFISACLQFYNRLLYDRAIFSKTKLGFAVDECGVKDGDKDEN